MSVQSPLKDLNRAESDAEKYIKIKVVSNDSKYSDVGFQIKYNTTKMKKIINAYCEKHGVDKYFFVFQANGIRITGEETAKQLELEEGDEIEANLHQTAGYDGHQFKLF